MLFRKCFMLKKIILVKAPLILGLVTGAVHYFEMKAVFAEGVLQTFSPLTVATALLTALSIAFFAFAAMKEPGGANGDSYSERYPSRTGFFILDILHGLAFIFAALWIMLYGEKTTPNLILAALSALAGLGVVLLGYAGKRGRDGALAMCASLAPAVLFSYLTALTYHDWAGSPSVLRYCWAVSAFGAAALGYLAFAGFAFGRGSRRQTSFFPMCAVFALTVLIFEGGEPWRMSVSCAALINIALNGWKASEKSF